MMISESNEQETNRKQTKDKFGFWNSDDFHKSLSVSNAEVQKRQATDNERIKKWDEMTKNWSKTTNFRASKLKSRVRKGIPLESRKIAWPLLGGTENFKAKFRSLKTVRDLKLDAQVIDDIERDVSRTFPNHDMFTDPDSPGQSSLRQVLQWYAYTDKEIGYCQVSTIINF